MAPMYTLEKIKFATDARTWQRAVGLYESGKVTQFKEEINGFSAVVLGGSPYHVYISAQHFDEGNCACYLGQEDVHYKHMVAVAIRAVAGGNALKEDEKQLYHQPHCSGKLGTLSRDGFLAAKGSITAAMRYIKPYNGPSRIWFAYQDSLRQGCYRLSAIVCELPVSEQTATLLVNLLLRLDKKLSQGGVDDSDGTVGTFIEETVQMLKEFVQLDSRCARAFSVLREKETCFGWEEELLR